MKKTQKIIIPILLVIMLSTTIIDCFAFSSTSKAKFKFYNGINDEKIAYSIMDSTGKCYDGNTTNYTRSLEYSNSPIIFSQDDFVYQNGSQIINEGYNSLYNMLNAEYDSFCFYPVLITGQFSFIELTSSTYDSMSFGNNMPGGNTLSYAAYPLDICSDDSGINIISVEETSDYINTFLIFFYLPFDYDVVNDTTTSTNCYFPRGSVLKRDIIDYIPFGDSLIGGGTDAYNYGYAAGVKEGEKRGYSTGHKEGYEKGYAEGALYGESNGLDDILSTTMVGVLQALSIEILPNFSILGLIGAILGAILLIVIFKILK